jgi:hypothetical protein
LVPVSKTRNQLVLGPKKRSSVLIRTLTDTQQSGYQQKALNKSNKPEGMYEHPGVGIKEIKQKERDLVPRTANYSRFSVYFSEWCLCSGGAYAPSNTVLVREVSIRLLLLALLEDQGQTNIPHPCIQQKGKKKGWLSF